MVFRVNPALLKTKIRTVPDWPVPPVRFRDITPILEDPTCYTYLVDWMRKLAEQYRVEVVAGIDARGFLFAGALAYQLQLPLVLIRKKGKLPSETFEESYTLEYGEAVVEMHADSIAGQRRVLLIDDLIATGGTLEASTRLLRRAGIESIHVASVIDLPELGGSVRMQPRVESLDCLCSFSESE